MIRCDTLVNYWIIFYVYNNLKWNKLNQSWNTFIVWKARYKI